MAKPPPPPPPKSKFFPLLILALVILAIYLANVGGFGSDRASADDALTGSAPLRMSLSRSADEAVANAALEQNYAIRFTMRNGTDRPATMDGIQLEQVEGDLRFTDALAGVRRKGRDREAEVFKGWPLDPKDVGIDDLGQFSTATVPPGDALDVLVAFRLGSGELGRFSGINVTYSSGGVAYQRTYEVAVTLCRGESVVDEGCIGQSQLDRLDDLNDQGTDLGVAD